MSDILGPIPNLQVGYLYYFGNGVRSGRLTLDYLLPVNLRSNSVVFGEAHGEFNNFWKTVSSIWRQEDTTPTTITTTTTTRSSFNERADLSIGGGYRKIFGSTTLLGVNAFFDATKLGDRWYDSGGVGLEYAALLTGNDAVDLTFNWYGNIFRSDVLANAFRRGPQNYDVQWSYSHELWNGGPDLRLSATGYRFSSGSGAYGISGAADLKTRDGMFMVRFEAAHDRVNQTYYTVGGFVNVGFQLANLLSGQSPLEMPAPIMKSPRNLRRLLSAPLYPDRRRIGQPTSIVLTRTTSTSRTEATFTTKAAVGIWFEGPGGAQFPTRIPIPDLSQFSRVVITWSGISGPSVPVTFLFTDSVGNQYQSDSVALTIGSGGPHVSALAALGPGGTSNTIIQTGASPFIGVKPGGGVTFTFRQ
ncbi:hypothetical protein ACFL2Q_06275 [Thermodesulfobacteriota bacterium]